MKSEIKSLLRRIGLFPIVRDVYRKASPSHRRERLFNRQFYGRLIREHDLCFDIGANVGQTIEALLELGAVVVAAEPNPLCLGVLKHQFSRSPSVTVVNKAVGSANGFVDLNFSGTSAAASIRKDWRYNQQARQTARVEVVTLDDLITQYGRPRFLKVDVEGFEQEVFKGLTCPVELIYFEMHSHELEVTLQILDRLGAIGKVLGIQVFSGDNSTWLIGDWVAPDQLIEKLGAPLPRQANVLMRMEQEQGVGGL